MDTLDHSTLPLWSVDEFGLEKINSACIGKYDYNSGGDIVVEEIVVNSEGNIEQRNKECWMKKFLVMQKFLYHPEGA